MAGTRAITYKAEILEQLRAKLRQLPEHRPEGLSKTDIVRSLATEIDELQRRGYSMKSIAEVISNEGVPITTVTLKGYLGRLKPQSRRARRKRSKDPAGEALVDREERRSDGAAEVGAENNLVVVSQSASTPEKNRDDHGSRALGDGNETSQVVRTPVGSLPSASTAEARRGAPAEADKRKSTFVPRDDSRDI